MSILPLVRDLLLDDYPTGRDSWAMRPRQVMRQPAARCPAITNMPMGSAFDQALCELQDVINNVNQAIGHYQNSLIRDIGTGGMKTQRTEEGNLQVAIECSQFKPEEVNVKLCDDNLVVEAKTESSENDSYHKAEFKRWVKLPADAKCEAIKSTMTPDKKLVIEIPMNKPIADSRSRTIPIEVKKKEADCETDCDKHNGGQKEETTTTKPTKK